MNDAENQDHAILLDHVIHDAVFAHPEAVERIARPLDRLNGLPADPPLPHRLDRQLLQRTADPFPESSRELLESADRRRRELDLVRRQSSSFRLVVRLLA